MTWAERYFGQSPEGRASMRADLAKNAIMGVTPTAGDAMHTEEQVAEAVEPVVEQPRSLNPSEMCDRCGAAASGYAKLPDDSELLFCAHHLRENADSLEAFGARVFGLEVFSS